MRTTKSILLLVTSVVLGISAALIIMGWAGVQSRASAAAPEAASASSDFAGIGQFDPPGGGAVPTDRPVMAAPGFPLTDRAAEMGDAAPRPMPAAATAPAIEAAPTKPGVIFTVINTNDSGGGSLRDAVTQANAAAGHDEIQFNLPGCPCAITLLSELTTSGELTMSGPGANLLTLSGNNANRIFATTAGNPLHLRGLTLANGFHATQGGGAVSSGSLTLENMVVRDSSASTGGGAIVDGTLVMTNTTIQNNTASTSSGGGIYTTQQLISSGSIFKNNTAYSDGGGAYVNGTATINGGSFENNQTTQVKSFGGGGGLMAFNVSTISGTQFLANSTPAWGGGAYLANFLAGTVNRLVNANFNGNQSAYGGGGLFQWLSANITDTIFIDNQSGTQGGGLYAGYAGNHTIRLYGGSIQDNTAATGGGLYSDGSFTLQNVGVYSNTATNGRGGGAISLNHAAVADSTFAYNSVITGGNGGGLVAAVSAAITDTTFLRNRVLGLVGSPSGGGLTVGTAQEVGNASLLRLTFTENSSTRGFAGGLLSYITTTLSDSTFSGNSSWNDGGGAWIGGPLTLSGSIFQGNQTLLNEGNGGGGGLMSMGQANVTDTQFISNTSADWGGGAYIYAPSAISGSQFNNTLFISNTATSGGGGGLFAWYTATLTSPTFTGNYAGYRGGGLYAGYAGNHKPQVNGGVFSGNSASGGGGMYSDTDIRLDVVEFRSNTARNGNGGGAWADKSARVADSLFTLNQVLAGGNSGGLDTGANAWLTDTIFLGNLNQTGNGGGLGSGGNASILRGEYRENRAANAGGGLLALGTATIQDTTFYSNTAGDQGGGVIAAQAAITRTTFENNTASSRGGGVMLTGGSSLLEQVAFLGNQAPAGGGLALEGTAGGSLVNSLFTRNSAAGGSGAALYMDSSGALLVQHTTIANPSLVSGSAVYVNSGNLTANNTIFANHSTGLARISGSADLQNPLFYGNSANTQGTGITINGAVNGDPAFYNPALDDYHLSVGSLAANAGLNSGVSSDFDGDARPQGGQVDIGYDEAVTPSGVDFTHNAPKPANQPVTFSGVVTLGQGVIFTWDFGDGRTAQGQTVTNSYTQPGIYAVKLTAANAAGQNQVSKNVTISKVTLYLYLPMVVR